MRDVARDPAALKLELLRVQRSRLADRMQPPWWYLPGLAFLWALVFAGPFSSQYLAQGDYWAIVVAALAVGCLLQWGVARATGIKVGFRNLRYPAAGRPVRIAIVVVSLATIGTEVSLIRHGLLVAAIVVAALAVVVEVVLQQAALRGIRQELRGGGGAA
jgi:hypothetical protein